MSPTASPRPLPRTALGVGLRPTHYAYLHDHAPALGYVEIITENFLGDAAGPRAHLDRVRARYPVVLHGVSLNLLGHAPIDLAYVADVARLAAHVDAPFVTDHLCWTGAHGVTHHDLLPTPYTDDLVDLAIERAAHVQRLLGRPFGLENLSTYVAFHASTMPEWEFVQRVIHGADCGLLLDINNVYVSAHNHGFDPYAYLDALDYDRVLHVHLAGHTRQPDGVIVDTHDHAVCDEVWQLYRHAWRRGGPFPTMVEWDAAIPPMPVVLDELARAAAVRTDDAPVALAAPSLAEARP